jgi:hypothetical protein
MGWEMMVVLDIMIGLGVIEGEDSFVLEIWFDFSIRYYGMMFRK